MPRIASELFLQVEEREGRATVRFPASIALSESNVEELSRQLGELIDRGPRRQIVLDLGGVTMLTSIILAKLIALHGRTRAAGGHLTLLNPTPVVHEVFKVTRLDTILDVQRSPS